MVEFLHRSDQAPPTINASCDSGIRDRVKPVLFLAAIRIDTN